MKKILLSIAYLVNWLCFAYPILSPFPFFKIARNLYYIVITSISIMIFSNASYAKNNSPNEVNKLITQHIEITGGMDALMKMQSISRYGYISFYESNKLQDTLCYHTDIVYPKKLREQIKGKEIAYDRGADGSLYWLWTGSQYEFTDDSKLMNYMRGTAERANREMLWIKKESDKFDIMLNPPSWAPKYSQCIQEIKSENDIKRTYCFDLSTGLLNAFGSKNEYRLEGDWRQVGDIKLPFRLSHYQKNILVYEVQLYDAELNKTIPDVQFVKPDSSQLSC